MQNESAPISAFPRHSWWAPLRRYSAWPKADPVGNAWVLACLALFALFAWQGWRSPILDPDYWWLRWIGDRILEGSYPRSNAWSWTAPEAQWITHEPGVGLAYALGGDEWAGLLRGLVISATGILLGLIAWRRHSAAATALGFAWAVLLVFYGRTERALTWGNLLLAATVALLGERPSARRLAMASVVVGLWASVHGSFVVGVFLVAAYSWRWGLVASGLTLVNPAGWRLWALVLGYGTSAGTKPFVHGVIPEWLPPDLADPHALFAVALLSAGVVLALWRAPWRAAVIVLPLVALGFRHQRFLEVAAIAALPWLSAALARLLPARPMRLPLGPFVAVSLALALTFRAHFDAAMFPPDFPFDRLAGRRVWNDFAAGAFLGYHGVRVFWDSRVDCYPLEVLAEGSRIEFSDRERLPLLDKWQVDTVVTARPTIGGQLSAAGWLSEGAYGQWTIYRRPPD